MMKRRQWLLGAASAPLLAAQAAPVAESGPSRGSGDLGLVIERETGLWLGRIGPWRPHDWPGTEVGWGLHPDAQGKGYGVEAATASIDYAFDVLGWTEVIHCIDPDNLPSQRLAERIGSDNLGPTRLPPPYHDLPDELMVAERPFRLV